MNTESQISLLIGVLIIIILIYFKKSKKSDRTTEIPTIDVGDYKVFVNDCKSTKPKYTMGIDPYYDKDFKILDKPIIYGTAGESDDKNNLKEIFYNPESYKNNGVGNIVESVRLHKQNLIDKAKQEIKEGLSDEDLAFFDKLVLKDGKIIKKTSK